MLDIALIRAKPDWVKAEIAKLGDDSALARIDRILQLDSARRATRSRSETAQAARNRLNRAMGKLRGNRNMSANEKAARANGASLALQDEDYDAALSLMDGGAPAPESPAGEEAFQQLIAALRAMGDGIDAGYAEAKQIEAELREEMLWLPNLPHASVPIFPSEEDNIPSQPVGAFREFDFEPKPHWELGPALGIIDFERGVKLAGSRYYVLQGWGARLQRALISFFLDRARANGYRELYLPYIVPGDMLYGSAQFPKFQDTVYSVDDGDRYLLPTSEVAIANLHRDEILEEAQLPLNYAAHTPCFRSEKASAGRDVRGIKRVHQFEKVEMFKFATPETSYAELETMTQQAEFALRRAGYPLPPAGNRDRRPRLQRDQEVRHRNVGARLRRVAGSQQLQQHRSLPGAARHAALLPARHAQIALSAYAQWQRVGHPARDYRHPGEQPAGGWKRRHSSRIAALPWRRAAHRSALTPSYWGVAPHLTDESRKVYNLLTLPAAIRARQRPRLLVPGVTDGSVSRD